MSTHSMTIFSQHQLVGIQESRYFNGKSSSFGRVVNPLTLISAARVTILIFDHIITFNRERQPVWSLRAGYLKWAFLINRYTVPLVYILNVHCLSALFFVQYWTNWHSFIALGGISDFGLSDKACFMIISFIIHRIPLDKKTVVRVYNNLFDFGTHYTTQPAAVFLFPSRRL